MERHRRTTRVLVGLLTAVVLLATASPSFAATPPTGAGLEPGAGSGSVVRSAAGAEDDGSVPAAGTPSPVPIETATVRLARASLRTFEQRHIVRRTCPADAPILERRAYASGPGWIVPLGVEVRADGGGRGLSVDVLASRGDVRTRGWAGGGDSRVANWSKSHRVADIVMHCVRPWQATVSRSYRVSAHTTETGITLACPTGAPYLADVRSVLPSYSGWQYVFVSGVRIDDRAFHFRDAPESGAILRAVARNLDGFQIGIADMSIIVRDTPKVIDVTLHCTADPAYAARW